MNERIYRDVRELSSGTVSTCIREQFIKDMAGPIYRRVRGRQLGLTPKHAADSYLVDRVQFALGVFVKEHGENESWDSWVDAWHAWLRALDSVRWTCSYMGGQDYEMKGMPGRLETKTRVSEYERSITNYSDEEFERRVVPKVGCLWSCSSSYEFGSFLPDRIACLFPMQSPVRFEREDEWVPVVSEDWPKPKIGVSPIGDRCSWDCDDRFDVDLDEWGTWKEEAAELAGEVVA